MQSQMSSGARSLKPLCPTCGYYHSRSCPGLKAGFKISIERQRKDDSFEAFYDQVLRSSKDFTDVPTLPRYSKRPRWIDDGEPGHRFENPKAYLKHMYFEAIDLCHGELTNHFNQTQLNGMPIAAAVEKLLLDAANGTLEDTCDISEILTLLIK